MSLALLLREAARTFHVEVVLRNSKYSIVETRVNQIMGNNRAQREKVSCSNAHPNAQRQHESSAVEGNISFKMQCVL